MKPILPTLLCLTPLLFGSPLLAQSAWTKVPALPRACYRAQDTFESDAEKVKAELEAAIEKQEQTNRGLLDKAINTDPAALQQRMMAAVQSNPARAQEMMQAMQSLGAAQQQTAVAADEEAGEFDDRTSKLKRDYQAESNELTVASRKDGRPTNAALAEYYRQYEKGLCPQWFGKEVPDLLTSYRTYLVEKRIPKQTEAEKRVLPMYELLGVPTKDFRPLAEMEAVLDYVRLATDLFILRAAEPVKP